MPRKKTPNRALTEMLNTMQKILIAIVVVFLWAACNPVRRIDMQNNSGQEAEIVITIKEDSILNSPFYMNNATELRLPLKTQHPYNLVKMTFGEGPWNNSFLADITDDLETMQITSTAGTITLNTPTDIEKFLMARRKGITRRKIKIYIDK